MYIYIHTSSYIYTFKKESRSQYLGCDAWMHMHTHIFDFTKNLDRNFSISKKIYQTTSISMNVCVCVCVCVCGACVCVCKLE